MKCRHFFSFALVLFFSFFFGFFIITNDSFAISDWSGTLDSSSSNLINICNQYNPSSSLSGHVCTDYKYIIFYSETNFSNVPSSGFYFYFDSYNRIQSNSINPYVLFSIPSSFTSVGIFAGNVSSAPSGWSVVVTFSDSLPGASLIPSSITLTENGSYDVTNYTEAIVDVENEVIQGDYHDDLVNIQKSIIICGAILLVLYFFYCIYRLIIKNSGVE